MSLETLENISIINDVPRASSQGRNYAILESLEKFWKEGKSIFVVYGASHAVMQERAIVVMIKD